MNIDEVIEVLGAVQREFDAEFKARDDEIENLNDQLGDLTEAVTDFLQAHNMKDDAERCFQVLTPGSLTLLNYEAALRRLTDKV